MVTDMEAAGIIRDNLRKKGFDVIDINKIAEDIKAIRERKEKGTKEFTEKWILKNR